MTIPVSVFSCPHDGEAIRLELLQRFWSDYAATLVDTFLIRFEAPLREHSDSIASALCAFRDAARSIEDPAAFPADLLLACASEREPDLAWAGATALLHVGGRIPPWRVTFERPRRLRIRSWLTPELRHLEQAGGELALESADGRRLQLPLTASPAQAAAAGMHVRPNIATPWGEVTLAAGDDADTWGFGVDNAWRGSEANGFVSALREALALIAAAAPAYSAWVAAAARTIIPVRRAPGYDTSHSFLAFPGFIVIGLPTNPVMLGELLVHETAHLHFGAVSKAVTLTTVDDQKLYYSPFPKADRKIDLLLFGFHAFANIGLFRRSCREAGIEQTSQDFDWQSEWMPEILEVCRHLQASPGITARGSEMWEPVAKRLFGARSWAL